MIYLDNNATTQLGDKVREAMLPFLSGNFYNPSSSYSAANRSRAAIEATRESVAAMLGARSAGEIAFTSGGTESDNWAIRGSFRFAGKRHIVTTAVEHEAVSKLCDRLEAEGCRVTRLGVDENGELDLDELRASLAGDTALVSVMMANNETGILFPVKEIGEIVKESSDALFHVDGVNAAGKVPLELSSTQIDLFSISAHKFHGPKGIGALYIKEGTELGQFMIGGGQESGRRAGTEAMHQIAGLGAAAELTRDLRPMQRVEELRDKLESFILGNIANTYLNGTSDKQKRLPNTSNISFENINGEMIMSMLDAEGICVSTGSACHAKDHKASPVLAAMNIPYTRAMGSVRFSVGRNNTESEIDEVIEKLPPIIAKLREIAGL